MTGNKVIDFYLNYDDDDYMILRLLDTLDNFREDIKELLEVKPNWIDLDETYRLKFVKIICIIVYKLNWAPEWFKDTNELSYDKPIFVGKHLDDFTKAKMILLGHPVFRRFNVYFQEEGLKRL